MKTTITFEGEYYEDRQDLLMFMHAVDYSVAISEALSAIRNRFKNYEVSDEEEKFLEHLQEILYVKDE